MIGTAPAQLPPDPPHVPPLTDQRKRLRHVLRLIQQIEEQGIGEPADCSEEGDRRWRSVDIRIEDDDE